MPFRHFPDAILLQLKVIAVCFLSEGTQFVAECTVMLPCSSLLFCNQCRAIMLEKFFLLKALLGSDWVCISLKYEWLMDYIHTFLFCRYPNISCELLTSDVSQINDRLGEEESLLMKLYSFLLNESPLNPLLASFFSKVLSILISRKPEQVNA